MSPTEPEPKPRPRLTWPLAILVAAILVAGGFALAGSGLIAGQGDGDDEPPIVTHGDQGDRVAERETAAEPMVSTEDVDAGPKLTRFTIASEAVGENLPISVLEPTVEAKRNRRPLLVFLHGAGGSDESSVNDAALLAALEDAGAKAPVMAFPEGRLGWWRDREEADWATYVVREVIPAVARRYDTDRRRVAIGGISMGGFGAYHLGLTYPRRFCAVGGHSAGLYLRYGEDSFGAFDSRADFRRDNVVAKVRRNPNAFGAAKIWNDYGDEDWFVRGNAAFVRALERGDAELVAHVWPGGHDGLYWSEHWPDYIGFYAESLADCDR